jgi:hypothetical protein
MRHEKYLLSFVDADYYTMFPGEGVVISRNRNEFCIIFLFCGQIQVGRWTRAQFFHRILSMGFGTMLKKSGKNGCESKNHTKIGGNKG